VRNVLADLAASGEPIPGPLSERAYSGKFVVRVPAEVHRRLVRSYVGLAGLIALTWDFMVWPGLLVST
jgi:hypothetical protein